MSWNLIEIGILVVLLVFLRTGFGKQLFRVALVKLLPKSTIAAIGKRAVDQQPDEIHLVKADGAAWTQRDQAKRLAAALTERGFVPAGTYTIQELPGVTCGFLVGADGTAYAIVYEHARVGMWTEIVSRYEDGTSVTYSNSRSPQMDQRPGHTVVRAPGFLPGALWARFQAERPPGNLATLTAENIVPAFEAAWREGIAWRKGRGGATRDEIERVARAGNWKR